MHRVLIVGMSESIEIVLERKSLKAFTLLLENSPLVSYYNVDGGLPESVFRISNRPKWYKGFSKK